MKYVKFFDHIAIAFAAYGKRDMQSVNASLKAAMTAPDAKIGVAAMLEHNETAFRKVKAASDIGVDVDEVGDELRVEPEQDVMASDDGDMDDTTMTEEDLESPSSATAKSVRASAQRILAFSLKTFLNKDGSKASSYNDADSFDSMSVQKMLKKDILNAALPQPDGDFLVASLPETVQTRLRYLDAAGNVKVGEPTPMPFKTAVQTASAYSGVGHSVILAVGNGFAVGVFRGDLKASAEKPSASQRIAASRAARDPKFAKQQYFASLRK